MNEQEAALEEWLAGRPQVICDLARLFPPWNAYRIKATGQHGEICSYSENGTLSLDIIGHDNALMSKMASVSPTTVFGIGINDIQVI